MTLAITTDKTSYSSGDTALISVTRDAIPPETGSTYTVNFLETDADGNTVDTGSVDLLVQTPGAGTPVGATTITATSDTLTVTQVSDDNATVVFSTVLP